MAFCERITVTQEFQCKNLAQILKNYDLPASELKFTVIDNTKAQLCLMLNSYTVVCILHCENFIDSMNMYGISERSIHINVLDYFKGFFQMSFGFNCYGEMKMAEIKEIRIEDCEDECYAQNACYSVC